MVREESKRLRGKEEGVVGDVFVTVHQWKYGVRKVQNKLTTLYEMRWKYFRRVN